MYLCVTKLLAQSRGDVFHGTGSVHKTNDHALLSEGASRCQAQPRAAVSSMIAPGMVDEEETHAAPVITATALDLRILLIDKMGEKCHSTTRSQLTVLVLYPSLPCGYIMRCCYILCQPSSKVPSCTSIIKFRDGKHPSLSGFRSVVRLPYDGAHMSRWACRVRTTMRAQGHKS
jgi:hypothetical protein